MLLYYYYLIIYNLLSFILSTILYLRFVTWKIFTLRDLNSQPA
jgi:hypothetical protein